MPASSTPMQTVLVHLPPELRPRAQQQAAVTVPCGSVREIITALEQDYPGLRFNLCAETGELRPFVNIFVDGRNIRFASVLDTPVAAGSSIHILRSVAGG